MCDAEVIGRSVKEITGHLRYVNTLNRTLNYRDYASTSIRDMTTAVVNIIEAVPNEDIDRIKENVAVVTAKASDVIKEFGKVGWALNLLQLQNEDLEKRNASLSDTVDELKNEVAQLKKMMTNMQSKYTNKSTEDKPIVAATPITHSLRKAPNGGRGCCAIKGCKGRPYDHCTNCAIHPFLCKGECFDLYHREVFNE